MSVSDSIGEATVHRILDHDHDVLVAHGRFGPLLQAFVDHTNRWEAEMDGLSFAMLRQGLAASALHLSHRPVDESMGLSLNFKEPPLNVFLAGDAHDATVTGRAFLSDVATAESSRLFLQNVRGAEVQNSVIEIEGLDVLDIFEQYYERSVQTPTRFFELEEENRFVMVQALPDADLPYLRGLTRESITTWLATDPREMHRRVFRFQCGCNPKRMLEVVRQVWADKGDELFRGQETVEATCPRCGTRWEITRAHFEGEDLDEEE
jgi:molecular chaperone Hsp33